MLLYITEIFWITSLIYQSIYLSKIVQMKKIKLPRWCIESVLIHGQTEVNLHAAFFIISPFSASFFYFWYKHSFTLHKLRLSSFNMHIRFQNKTFAFWLCQCSGETCQFNFLNWIFLFLSHIHTHIFSLSLYLSIYLSIYLSSHTHIHILAQFAGAIVAGLVAPDKVLCMGQIELNYVLMLNWIV